MTIKDLAAKTGYAVGTVSRVLNNHPNVSEKARKTILAAVEESGFQLNVNAKQLKQTHANTVLVIVKGTGNFLFAQMVEVIQNLLAETNYDIHVDYMHGAENEVLRAVQLSREKKAVGVLFLGGNHENFKSDFYKLDIPGVLVTNDAAGLGFDKLSSVYVDNFEASRQALEVLIERGHRRFAVIGGHRKYSDTSQQRWEGALHAIRAHDLTIDPELDYATVYFSAEGGYQAVVELLERGRNFTAIYTMSDLMAIGAIRALTDRGIRVPQDVSVVGFDGLPLGQYLVPRLSTIDQPGEDMARRSVEILMDTIKHGTPARHEAVAFTLLRRESVGSIV